MSALVSVIIPAYNCASTVVETVESVLGQDYPAIEAIVVNDGSTDKTLEVLDGMADRIRVIDQPNSGPATARNAGMAAARGKYLAFIDADDVWLPGKVSAQVRHLQSRPEVGAVSVAHYLWEPGPDGLFEFPPSLVGKRVTDDVHPEIQGWLYGRLLFKSVLLTSAVMLRRDLAERVGGFDRSLWKGEDYDYWIRISREAQISRLASVGVLYRQLPGSMSRTPKDENFELEVVTRALKRWGATGPDGRAVDARRLAKRLESLELDHGYIHLHAGRPEIAWQVFRTAVVRHPTNARYWVNALRARVKMLRQLSEGLTEGRR